MATSSTVRKLQQLDRDKKCGITTFGIRAFDEDKVAIKAYAKKLFGQRRVTVNRQMSQADRGDYQ